MKKTLLVMAMAIALALSTMAGAFADEAAEVNQGIDCSLNLGGDFDNPGEMLKFLTGRDGHFQNTVEQYGSFNTVADLVHQKCWVG